MAIHCLSSPPRHAARCFIHSERNSLTTISREQKTWKTIRVAMRLTDLQRLTETYSKPDQDLQTYTPFKGCKCKGLGVRLMRTERITCAVYLSKQVLGTRGTE